LTISFAELEPRQPRQGAPEEPRPALALPLGNCSYQSAPWTGPLPIAALLWPRNGAIAGVQTAMHGSNGHYSHRTILNRYAGVAEGTPLPGLLQHGWNHDLGAVRGDVLIPAPDPFFLWNRRNLEHCQRAGLGHAVAVGAPFLYLPPADPPQPTPRSLIAVPLHSWEKVKIQQDFEQYAAALAQIAGQFSRVAVSLYWFDYQDPANRAVFERRGMEVVTVGARDSNPNFLSDQRQMLLGYSHVTSNRVQTGLFYALALGLRGFLHGPPMGVEDRIDRTGELFDAWQRREFPELAGERFGDDDLRWLGERELGLEFKRTPEQLRELFQWNPLDRLTLERRCWDFRVRHASPGRSRLWRRWQRFAALRALKAANGSAPP
jgi:hypothetical protein